MVVQVPNNLIFVFIVINNNEKASFDEVLDKTKLEIVKSHGDVTKTFKKFCKGKNKKKDKKKLQKKIENAFKKKISQLVALISKFFIQIHSSCTYYNYVKDSYNVFSNFSLLCDFCVTIFQDL